MIELSDAGMRPDAEKRAAAKAMHERQRHYDQLHHLKRLRDLDGVTGWLAITLRHGSNECLRLTEQGLSTNSVDLSDAEYLTNLDQFEQCAALKGADQV